MEFVTLATSHQERDRAADVAVLPVGSFEQHGGHLPLSTDTLVACILAKAISDKYSLFLLPPLSISCSHEHAGFPGTVSITASTLTHIITDVMESLRQQGILRLLVVNGHGGNYVLNNIAQQANIAEPRILVFPNSTDWDAARKVAELTTNAHEDMHAGEGETSILLHYEPSSVQAGWDTADVEVTERQDLLMLGMRGYTKSGVIGRPSLASAEKGLRLIDALASSIEPRLLNLGHQSQA